MESTSRPTTSGSGRWPLIALIAAVVGFLIGFGWQFMRARDLSRQLDVAQAEALWSGLEATLGAATIEAMRGGFEPARQQASSFFSGLQASIDRAPTTATASLQQILSERDETITALSRSDPQAPSVLAQMLNRYRSALGRTVPSETAPVTPPPDSPAAIDTPRDSLLPTTTTGS